MLASTDNSNDDNWKGFIFLRSGFASYILGLDENSANQRKQVEDMFFPVFSALLDALLLRAQVSSLLVCIAIR